MHVCLWLQKVQERLRRATNDEQLQQASGADGTAQVGVAMRHAAGGSRTGAGCDTVNEWLLAHTHRVRRWPAKPAPTCRSRSPQVLLHEVLSSQPL